MISKRHPPYDFQTFTAPLRESLISQQCDEHWTVEDADARPVARCSLWWNTVPAVPDEKLGVIGHFSAESDEAGVLLLGEVAQRLAEIGCTMAVGPMDGNTWRKYRLVTYRGTELPFFLEPDNPDSWPGIFVEAGFEPLSTYCSALNDDMSRRDPRAERAHSRLEDIGVKIRRLDLANYEEELRRIYSVSISSFVHNYLYTALSEAEFLGIYLPHRERIQPDLVLLAEHDERTVGYVFAIPDYAQALRGQKIDTVIGKTLAVLPDRVYGGLGVVLTDQLHKRSRELGYWRVIHALQHLENHQVRNMSEHYGKIMRRYTLYSRAL